MVWKRCQSSTHIDPSMPLEFYFKSFTLSSDFTFCKINKKTKWKLLEYLDKFKGITHHLEKTRKNLWTNVDATALGYNWQVLATSIAHETPPRNPSILEYIPRPRLDYYSTISMFSNHKYLTNNLSLISGSLTFCPQFNGSKSHSEILFIWY